ncbi:hypothetical protein DFS33DRAFT_653207 [Desarmillaria ectypa]|nr:hypothetical protein DFS33DRAFT_653207 [Desarmillaria ectypa]
MPTCSIKSCHLLISLFGMHLSGQSAMLLGIQYSKQRNKNEQVHLQGSRKVSQKTPGLTSMLVVGSDGSDEEEISEVTTSFGICMPCPHEILDLSVLTVV